MACCWHQQELRWWLIERIRDDYVADGVKSGVFATEMKHL
jgi:hypothetical protein